jgi:hypothetical protein
MARKKRSSANKPGKKAERKGQAARSQGRQPSRAKDSAKGIATQPQPPVSKAKQRGPSDQREPRPGPQPSSLSDALYLWLSRKPALLQNTILLVFAICTLLFFSASVVEVSKKLRELLPKKVPGIQGVIRNASDLDVVFSKTGDFTIQTSPPVHGRFDLCPVQAVAATNSEVITVPGKGGQVNVCAEVRNPRKVYEYYRGGEYPLTLILAADTQRYMAQIERFSKTGIKKEWTASIPKNITSQRVIKVCFDELSDISKRSILQDETHTDLSPAEGLVLPQDETDTDLPPAEGLVLLQDETDTFKDDLEDRVERGRFFGMISKQQFNEIADGKEPDPRSPVFAKIAIGIYETKKGKKMILLEVTDARGKIKKREATTYSKYNPGSQENTVGNFITFATNAIVRRYPIKGRISDVSRDRNIVEMRIGRLAGVREYMELYVYCGEISRDTHIGDVKITATWPGSCEGTLHLNGTYDTKKTFTSLVVCSSTLEEWK